MLNGITGFCSVCCCWFISVISQKSYFEKPRNLWDPLKVNIKLLFNRPKRSIMVSMKFNLRVDKWGKRGFLVFLQTKKVSVLGLGSLWVERVFKSRDHWMAQDKHLDNVNCEVIHFYWLKVICILFAMQIRAANEMEAESIIFALKITNFYLNHMALASCTTSSYKRGFRGRHHVCRLAPELHYRNGLRAEENKFSNTAYFMASSIAQIVPSSYHIFMGLFPWLKCVVRLAHILWPIRHVYWKGLA